MWNFFKLKWITSSIVDGTRVPITVRVFTGLMIRTSWDICDRAMSGRWSAGCCRCLKIPRATNPEYIIQYIFVAINIIFTDTFIVDFNRTFWTNRSIGFNTRIFDCIIHLSLCTYAVWINAFTSNWTFFFECKCNSTNSIHRIIWLIIIANTLWMFSFAIWWTWRVFGKGNSC